MHMRILFFAMVGVMTASAAGIVPEPAGIVPEPGARGDTPEAGSTPLFNGKDLTGWHGLKTMDPRSFEALSPDEKAKALAAGAEDLAKHWRVENGEIVNDGQGAYLTSDKDYGDIELLIDFK